MLVHWYVHSLFAYAGFMQTGSCLCASVPIGWVHAGLVHTDRWGQRGFYFSWRICIVTAAARLSCLLSSDLLLPPTLHTLNKLVPCIHSWTLMPWLCLRSWLYILSLRSLCQAYILKNTKHGAYKLLNFYQWRTDPFSSYCLSLMMWCFSRLRSLNLRETSTATICLPSPGSTVSSQVCDLSGAEYTG